MQGRSDCDGKQRQDSEADELQPEHGDAGRFHNFIILYLSLNKITLIYSWTIAIFKQEPRATWRCTMEPFETAHLLRWVHQPNIGFFLPEFKSSSDQLADMKLWSLSLFLVLFWGIWDMIIWSDLMMWLFYQDGSGGAPLLISAGAGDCKVYVTDCTTSTPFQVRDDHDHEYYDGDHDDDLDDL